MKPVYNQNGTIIDFSDEGEQINEINNEIDLLWLIKKLPKDEQKIAKMISEGYTWREIKDKLKIGHLKIQRVFNKIQAQIASKSL